MADHEHLSLARSRPAVECCWMCGIRLPVTQMVADGDSACNNLRWYCLDVRGCTERWTTRATLPNSVGSATGGAAHPRAAAGA